MPDDAPTLPALDILLPATAAATGVAAVPDEPVLGPLLAHPAASDRPGAVADVWVRANMISTIDGAAWGHDHLSGSINGPADLRVFEVLRALADVVLVGAGTVRAEGYGPVEVAERVRGLRRTAGRDDTLWLAIVTRSGEVPAALASDPSVVVATGVLGAARLEGLIDPERLLVCGTDDIDLRDVLGSLAERGLGRVLTEGGPHLLAALLAADLVDDLCVTTSPHAVGPGAGRIVAGESAEAHPAAVHLATLLRADDVLMTRWTVA
ncbi:dihydrofolate reductase family protein [Sanguibacter sp. A247]|uniref:dihydrofolate reductase family protein n=1 Tax=unclassified Sanguibacter TaxID=2645534 RepID=UPI003FD76B86